MLKRFRHILMLAILLSGALEALAQNAMPDRVCVGTTRHYYVNGSVGSTYTWQIDGVTQASTADNIDIIWINTGTFTLTVQEHLNGCDGDVQSGLVIVDSKTTPTFDPVGPFCPGANIPALPTTSLNGITGTWSPAINNTVTTTYTFTPAADECAVPVNLTITVEDNIPPTFTTASSFDFCVEDITDAIYNSNQTSGIVPEYNDLTIPRPEYYLFRLGNTIFDLDGVINNFDDNCCPVSTLTPVWRIEFSPVPNPATAAHELITKPPIPDQTVKPSTYGNIEFPADGVTFNYVTHYLYYRLVDCNGNSSPEKMIPITITPRPNITKD